MRMECEEDAYSNAASPIPAPFTAELEDHYDGPPLSPKSEKYRLKTICLQQKFDYIHLSNNRLRNRLYHIKKEINHLKRLKRILCQRLLMFGDRFMDSCLEIPDSEPTQSGMDKVIGDVAAKVAATKKRKFETKRMNDDEFISMEQKARNSIISIIDSVITESHEERMRAHNIHNNNTNRNKDINANQQLLNSASKTPRNNSSISSYLFIVLLYATALLSLIWFLSSTCFLFQSDADGRSITERMLRPSSIDHLLPSEPDPDPQEDPEDVLTGFGENLEENFMAID
ncbi:unnamed protein product [Anisakis simplex]|uniref:Uncharacterized protein n=1 Tax=Anisakis simplex TaxID=6269 RepID=A0A3P6RUB8_ANISI|nr:unnamed protein product [Anisakis simplex]